MFVLHFVGVFLCSEEKLNNVEYMNLKRERYLDKRTLGLPVRLYLLPTVTLVSDAWGLLGIQEACRCEGVCTRNKTGLRVREVPNQIKKKKEKKKSHRCQ